MRRKEIAKIEVRRAGEGDPLEFEVLGRSGQGGPTGLPRWARSRCELLHTDAGAQSCTLRAYSRAHFVTGKKIICCTRIRLW